MSDTKIPQAKRGKRDEKEILSESERDGMKVLNQEEIM